MTCYLLKIGANYFLRFDVVISTVVAMDTSHKLKLFSVMSISLAAVARLNTLLAVIFERKHRLKMRNWHQ